MTTTTLVYNPTTFEDMARDALTNLGFGHREEEARYGALDAMPKVMDTRLALDGALDDAVCVSTPRAPFDLHFTSAEVKPGRDDLRDHHTEEQEYVYDEGSAGYDPDATLPIEGDYAYATEEEKATQSLLCAPRESEEEAMEVEEVEAAPSVAAAPAAAVPVVSLRVCLAWQPKMKTWAGAVPAKKTANKNKKDAHLSIKKLRVALPVGVLDNNEEATLAHGTLVKGMAGSKREERVKLIETARQLGRASRAWARAIGR
jgi:hypothetical protein